jgi:hypothetical protein
MAESFVLNVISDHAIANKEASTSLDHRKISHDFPARKVCHNPQEFGYEFMLVHIF